MKRRIALFSLCAVSLVLALLLIPKGQAERDARTTPPVYSAPRRAVVSRSDDKIKPEVAGLPNVLDSRSPLSASMLTAVGGSNTQFDEVSLLANWDGREDYTADRGQKVDDFSFVLANPDQFIIRTAISEHTVANGFAENVYYYGDSFGNFYVGTDLNPGVNTTSNPAIDTATTINIPALVTTGSSGGMLLIGPTGCSAASVIITGISVNPVADLGDFGMCGTVGEIVYVSVLDPAGCGGLTTRSRILALAFRDQVPGVAPVGAIQVITSPLSNKGVVVDDDGSIYFQLSDMIGLTGGGIFKVTEQPHAICATTGRINRAIAPATAVDVPSLASGPINFTGGRVTNYGGGSAPLFGNIAALATGPNNVLYAAVSRSFVASDDINTRATEGPFTNPAGLGPTPSMVISLADAAGALDVCSGETGAVPANVGGVIPVADGVADVAVAGATLNPGINNFRVFLLGNGPDIRPPIGGTSPIVTSSTLKLNLQIDPTFYAGLMVDELGTLFVVHGGTPAGVGANASATFGEVQAYPDQSPADRRADFIDLRGDALPNPPASGGNVGDGDSDRFDHIFWRAPLDPINGTPSGISGLARGFLRYTNRLAPNAISTGVALGQSGGPNKTIQGDDDTDGPIFFESLDPGHQVAGGDDQNTPFRGDDNDGAGNTAIAGALNGGFEYAFGGPVGTAACVWNSFFLNSNGNITFGAGDTDNTPTILEFRSNLPRIAPTWADLNPSSRAVNVGTFPVQALGFADVNAFRIRNINVPEFGKEICSGTGGGASNTFTLTLWDDGRGIDENANQPLNPANPIGNNAVPFDLQEGPNDLRFVREPNTNILVGEPPRRDGSGYAVFGYGRMDLLGTVASPVITGYSIGGLDPLNPPGLCELDLGEAARTADTNPFGVIQGETASIQTSLIGEGTEPTLFELFDCGTAASIGPAAQINLANADFDLRFEGNDSATSSPAPTRQPDPNKDNVGFFGVSCAPPANPLPQTVLISPFVTTPTTTGLINALGDVTVNIVGSGFFPNEVTQVCQVAGTTCSPPPIGGGPPVPTMRPGKVVSTALTLSIDTNGDGIPDAVVALTNVTPVSANLIRGTLHSINTLPGTAFPLTAGGGAGTYTITSTFTSGDNNIFGPFTRSAPLATALGVRAPVVLGVTASSGNCGLPQDVLVSGSSFIINGVPNVTSVLAVDQANPTTQITASSFTILSTNQIIARFNFGAANSGKMFLIFAAGPNGTSRNLTSLPPGTPAGVPLGNEQGNVIKFTCSAANLPNVIQFSELSYTVTEGATAANLNLTRRNPTPDSVSVDYATLDGSARQNSDYTLALGRITFVAGETSKTISILLNDDSYAEGTEALTVALTNAGPTAVIGDNAATTITIVDNDTSSSGPNVIDDVQSFVRQQYHDFLNRDPDAGGLSYWSGQLAACGTNTKSINARRVDISAAFFIEREFQQTGFYVYLVHKALNSGIPNYNEFMHGRSSVADGSSLDASKTAFATECLAAPEYLSMYEMSPADYVDTLNAHSGNVLSLSERNTLVADLSSGAQTRPGVLRAVAENSAFRQQEYNSAFVLMQYFGFLRRDPDAGGFSFWLNVLNNRVPGNFRSMVCAFITSGEYQDRFGATRAHSNADCAAIGP
ncbi:MAG TPA: Calx-beta domain-containing protein [Pyrinomonadaceae bacterium]|nr:Calx-beta domain-containing protein [Pyrinomonadaceae bacterium]